MTNEEILETIFQLVAAAAAAEVELFICIWCVLGAGLPGELAGGGAAN